MADAATCRERLSLIMTVSFQESARLASPPQVCIAAKRKRAAACRARQDRNAVRSADELQRDLGNARRDVDADLALH
ncbi:hypothetical protein, partial [Rudaea sp.]|uniref:hypothetical protein n=1 Tax=Rudaea sp. TaxID=2136325 RepID=UPI002ED5EED8